MKIILKLFIVLLAAVALTALVILHEKPIPEHQVFISANVLTMDSSNSVAQAVSVRGEVIEAVGSNDQILALVKNNTKIYRLNGATLLPGFIDAHGHFPGSGLSTLGADLNPPPIGGVQSIAQLQQRLVNQADKNSGNDWIIGFSYDDSLLVENRHPSRADLDAVSSTRPIFIMHISGHMGVLNSAGLNLLGIDKNTVPPVGGVIVRDVNGEPTGLVQETMSVQVQAAAMDIGFVQFFKMVEQAAREYTAKGITTAQSGGVDGRLAQALMLASRLKRIPQRIELWPMWDTLGESLLNRSKKKRAFEWQKVHLGAIKMVTDGSIQGFTGYLSKPYATVYEGDDKYRGFPAIPKNTLIEKVLAFHQAGYQLAMHGNGDAAIDNILDAVELAQQHRPDVDRRHIIVHAQMAREDQIIRMKELGVTPSFFSAHTYYWGDRHRDIFMGPERAANMSPTAWAKKHGLRFSVHLDTPVTPMQPMQMLWSTVNRISTSGAVIGEHQRLSVIDALRAMTIDAAWQIHQEKYIGSIEVGKLADFVVLSDDPRAQPIKLRDIRVLQTIIGGRQYYSSADQ